MGGGRQQHVSALQVAVVIRPPEAGKPQADLKTTHQQVKQNFIKDSKGCVKQTN
jgi:hypothetical protein